MTDQELKRRVKLMAKGYGLIFLSTVLGGDRGLYLGVLVVCTLGLVWLLRNPDPRDV